MENLTTKDFDYDLPKEQIAQTPAQKRDCSRLLVVNKNENTTEDRHFHDIIEYLNPGDLLIMNDTRVLPARIFGYKENTGGKIELLLLKRRSDQIWETMVKPGRKAQPGVRLTFGPNLKGEILEKIDGGLRTIRFEYEGVFEEILDEIGTLPLPPYIHEQLKEQERYQTVYAKNTGSSAAPTAGLHFTKDLIKQIKEKGVKVADVTLHVGIGTFRPVKADQLKDHHMHEETYRISQETVDLIKETKANGGRVIAVGTTSVRTLESVAQKFDGDLQASSGNTNIFIYPGYKWQVVDALITNFHLPESTLLMLVSAFYNREAVLKIYQEAIEKKYRFFSFGDAMFLY